MGMLAEMSHCIYRFSRELEIVAITDTDFKLKSINSTDFRLQRYFSCSGWCASELKVRRFGRNSRLWRLIAERPPQKR